MAGKGDAALLAEYTASGTLPKRAEPAGKVADSQGFQLLHPEARRDPPSL
jgi:hypothetical protein